MSYTCDECGKKSKWFILICSCYPKLESTTQEEIDDFNRVHEEYDEEEPFGYEKERDRKRQSLINSTGDGRETWPARRQQGGRYGQE